MNIQAIFFDIDGTLVSFDTHSVPQSTVEAIKLLRQKDIKLIIATGRALCDINNLEGLQIDGYITANGAYCVIDSEQVLFKNQIPRHNLEQLIECQKQNSFPCIFMTEKGNFANYIDDSVKAIHQMVNLPLPLVKPIEEIIECDVFQIDTFVTEAEESVLLSTVLTECEGNRWHPSFVDINVKNNTKSTGVNVFLNHFEIDLKNSMAFGDGGNDISMLKHVGIGIAMGNARDEVKAIADHVTASVDENGIINALKHYNVLELIGKLL